MPMNLGLGLGLGSRGDTLWWLSGSALDLDFANNRAYNSLTGFNGSPNGILTYTSPSQKLVYGADGVLRYAPHNVLLRSQAFDNAAWTKASVSVTANAAAAPDGTTTAEKIVATNTASAVRLVYQAATVLSAFTYTFSVYVKASEYSKVLLCEASAGRFGATFDLAAGTSAAVGGAGLVSRDMIDVGNGWYRCVVTWTSSATSPALTVIGYPTGASITTSGATYAGDGVSGVYAWGAQLSLGATLFDYIPTTSAAIYSLPIDHDPITHAPLGVLIEEQRTNLLTYSEQFDNAAWAKGSATVTANAITAPDGTTTADKIVEVAATATHNVAETVTIVSATVYTYSVYAKAGERSWLCLEGGSGAGGYSVWFDLATGAVGTVSGTSSSNVSMTALENGWYRCVVTDTSTSTTGVYRNFVCTADNTQSYAGDGTSGLYLWGAQLEAGAFATSYIPTVASQVTRAADSVSILTSAFAYNSAAGTVFVDANSGTVAIGNNRRVWALSDGTLNNAMDLRQSGSTTGITNITVAGVSQAALSSAMGASVNAAFAYAVNDFAVSIDGASVVTDVSGTVPGGITTLGVGIFTNVPSRWWNGHISRLTYFPTRKTNAELQALSA